MAVKVSPSDLPELYSWLQKHFPETIWLCTRLRNHLREEIPGLQWYVDRWPDCQAVLAGIDTNSPGALLKGYFKNRFNVFGLTDHAVTSLVKETDLVDWSTSVHFDGFPSRLLTTFRGIEAESEGLTMTIYRTFALTATAEHVKALPVPKGLKLGPISEGYIHEVSAPWVYKGEQRELYILSQLRRYPSVMLTTESGQHVGHMMGQHYAKMAALFVQPQFRGKGYAKVLVSQLAQIYFDKGEDSHVYLYDWNKPSLHLHLSLGFQLVPDLEIISVDYKPKTMAE